MEDLISRPMGLSIFCLRLLPFYISYSNGLFYVTRHETMEMFLPIHVDFAVEVKMYRVYFSLHFMPSILVQNMYTSSAYSSVFSDYIGYINTKKHVLAG